MTDAETKYRNLPDREITIDEAITICARMLPSKPHLSRVITRIEELREERDLLYRLANESLSICLWKQSE
jgi:hypothetical protein